MPANVNFDKNFVNDVIPVLDEAGDTIEYEFSVTHQGGTPITRLLLSDDLLGLVDYDLLQGVADGDLVLTGDDGDGVFEVGETWLFTEAVGSDVFTYTTVQEDFDSNGTRENPSPFADIEGQIDNAASLTTFNATGVQQSSSLESASAVLDINPDIDIEKYVNGEDADDPTGPSVVVGDSVTFTYDVTNTGNVALSNVVVVDDNGTPGDTLDDITLTLMGGDDDLDGLLDVGETWTYQMMGTATAGQYTNIAVVTGEFGEETVEDSDPANYFGVEAGISIVKETEGTDDECPTLIVGSEVVWTYTVTNTGDVALSNVTVTDDNGTPLDDTDDFTANYVSGDSDEDGQLDTTETWIFDYTGTVTAGEYDNVATANGAYVEGETIVAEVEASEEDCYEGVTPTINIVKTTNGTDDECPLILVGSDVTWTYTVTNGGPMALSNIVVMDDNGTPLDDSDDFAATYVSGDDNEDGILDLEETWIFQAAGTAAEGEYGNTATVTGDATDDSGYTQEVTDSEEDCYEGATASIDLVKTTNGTDDLCPTVEEGSTVTWGYTVTNTGDLGIGSVVLMDDNGTPLDTSDDFAPTYVGGDDDEDGILDVGETWTYEATGTAVLGEYHNTATVEGVASDAFQNTADVSATEDDCYTGGGGPEGCVRTPGFWKNHTEFWDGTVGNEPKQAGQDGFPMGEIQYDVDSNNDGVIDGADADGFLIGDYNLNGLTDIGEDTIFISEADALALLQGKPQMNDGVVKIGRDAVATWLNYVGLDAGIGTTADDESPMTFLDAAIDFLQMYGDAGAGQGADDETFDIYSSSHVAVKTGSSIWTGDVPGNDVSGSEIHGALDYYNNHGMTSPTSTAYAEDCDSELESGGGEMQVQPSRSFGDFGGQGAFLPSGSAIMALTSFQGVDTDAMSMKGMTFPDNDWLM